MFAESGSKLAVALKVRNGRERRASVDRHPPHFVRGRDDEREWIATTSGLAMTTILSLGARRAAAIQSSPSLRSNAVAEAI